MGLTGVRDISTIETAPEDRLPVVTYVGKRDDELIRQAVLRELDRGGQVFYVHNRVQTIYTEAEALSALVPEATIAVGHGQMAETALEAVMSQFAAGQIEILVSTSIIEAGLDIPNANTLIVDRADLFGLSQLHQLRGRVGRSANRAFAYFFHSPLHSLTPEALARLDTIAEQVELGAGMNIAMRDLEIRGAGDILGIRQHGQIAAVGFHLFTRMMSQAVARMKAEYGRESSDATTERGESDIRENVTIDLPIPTYIPTGYLPDSALRIQLYRRMADLGSEEAVAALGAELIDRFGPLPEPVQNLLFQLQVRQRALNARIDSITSDAGQIVIRMAGLAYMDRLGLQTHLGHGVRVSRAAIWLPRATSPDGDDGDSWRQALLSMLGEIERMLALDLPHANAS
jgi:transcription-repair coupling factor (superfamily II helicase)